MYLNALKEKEEAFAPSFSIQERLECVKLSNRFGKNYWSSG
jgi:hypothetical protein